MPTETTLLTAEEYMLLPDDGRYTELVRGEVVGMAMPTLRHGEISSQIGYRLRRFFDDRPVGRVMVNGPGVVTERGPDTVRGPDVVYLSYANYPKGPLPQSYANTPPEVVFEVRSQSDRWSEVEAKVAEYLAAGVTAVCVADEPTASVRVHRKSGETRLAVTEELSLPEIHADLRIAVSRIFE